MSVSIYPLSRPLLNDTIRPTLAPSVLLRQPSALVFLRVGFCRDVDQQGAEHASVWELLESI